ncbi:ribonuclease HII [Jannaschia sp. W003]|uniref:ribonuclease HII n=1 Tax=Jannaschia sp. W003 TaxID=2867012 RepID=UPI0021A92808|nr:ribonuclease HII [Jannaschia sp. W003]UWQ22054.1 ribonuclease HII [Jannaschia sp. W003]
MPGPDLHLEREAHARGRLRVAGVDEVGRGPWAGPVTAAAVILVRDAPPGVDDSKRVGRARREALEPMIRAASLSGVGEASVAEIDALGIVAATALAMRRAVAALPEPPDHLLVDGRYLPPGLPCEARAVIRGDGLSLSVAAASVLAKTWRDRGMVALAQQHPGYGWERNAGYGTREHRVALGQLGVTQHHRRSFAPIRNMLC